MKPKSINVLFFLFIALSQSFPQTASEPRIEYDKKGRPSWVVHPQRVFDAARYLYGIGSGASQQDADTRAFADLIKFFGTSIESSTQGYEKIIENNAAESQAQIIIEAKISASMQHLIGAKIYDRWEDKSKKKSVYHAVAVIEKPEARKMYTQLIDANLAALEIMNVAPAAETNLAAAFKRQQNMADIANANKIFANILTLIGGPNRMASVMPYFDYNAEAKKIADSVIFDTMPPQSLERGELLSKKIKISSELFKTIGSVDCNVSVKNKTDTVFSNNGIVKQDDTFLLEVPTGNLAAGNYTVQLELLLSGITSNIQHNPRANFSLEIKPVPVAINFEGDKLLKSEENALLQTVTEVLQNNQIVLQNACVFVIVCKTEYIGELILGEVSIALLKDGNVLRQSETKRITELDKRSFLRLAIKFVRDNSVFWSGVKEVLEK